MPFFDVIVPVYNRPHELQELLATLAQQTFRDFQVLVLEDGSTIPSRDVCLAWASDVPLVYRAQPNAGPAAARNAAAYSPECTAEYLVFVDSDCLLPADYLALSYHFARAHPNVACYGGPDRAHPSFTPIQKAISYSMTSLLTTGGIRGKAEQAEKFTPRTFNMTVARQAFQTVHGFHAHLRYGEDVDLSLRLREAGYQLALCREAFVYHKRRTSFRQFFWQVYHSGAARWGLALSHRDSLRLVHLLPSAAVVLLVGALALSWTPLGQWLLGAAALYALALFCDALRCTHALWVALLSVVASAIQVIAYGVGFLVQMAQYPRRAR